MKHIKVFESTGKPLTLRWRRVAADNSRSGIAYAQSLRGWNMLLGNEVIGGVYNNSYYALSGNDDRKWYVMFHASPRNLTLKNRFDEGAMEDAKKFAEDALPHILVEEQYASVRAKIVAETPRLASVTALDGIMFKQ